MHNVLKPPDYSHRQQGSRLFGNIDGPPQNSHNRHICHITRIPPPKREIPHLPRFNQQPKNLRHKPSVTYPSNRPQTPNGPRRTQHPHGPPTLRNPEKQPHPPYRPRISWHHRRRRLRWHNRRKQLKHGFFDRIVIFIEIVLANGSVVICSSTELAGLFHGAGGASGTLGIVTLTQLQLIQEKKYVEITYHPVSSIAPTINAVKVVTKNPTIDDVDGILFSPHLGAIITGHLTSCPTLKTTIHHFSRASKPWSYLHVRSTITKYPTAPTAEPTSLANYLSGYDRGAFRVKVSAIEYFGVPFKALTRWFLDDFLYTRMLYSALHASRQEQSYIVQDLAIPSSAAEKFVTHKDEKLGIWPLWLCPLLPS